MKFELFTLELGVAFRKQRVEADQQGVAHRPEAELTHRLAATVPFEPTGAQRRAIAEVADAMAAPKPMNVLLQGDVGAGKTLVALHACLVAVQSGHQAAIMAPTEVLAAQHYRSIDGLLEGVGAARAACRHSRRPSRRRTTARSRCSTRSRARTMQPRPR